MNDESRKGRDSAVEDKKVDKEQVTLRLFTDVKYYLKVQNAKGKGTMSDQVNQLVRADMARNEREKG